MFAFTLQRDLKKKKLADVGNAIHLIYFLGHLAL